MAKFHINSKGEAGKCSATKGGCPFGGESEHYTSPEAAREGYEKQMKDANNQGIASVTSKQKVKTDAQLKKTMSKLTDGLSKAAYRAEDEAGAENFEELLAEAHELMDAVTALKKERDELKAKLPTPAEKREIRAAIREWDGGTSDAEWTGNKLSDHLRKILDAQRS